jgi:hypothetical protein
MKNLTDVMPRRSLVALAVAAAVVAGTHFGVLAPLERRTEAVNARARGMAADVTQVSMASQEVTEWLRRDAGDAGPDISQGDALSPELAVPALLQKLSELGERHSVRVISIRPEAPDAPISMETGAGGVCTYVRIPMHVTARARYRLLGDFLDDLRREGGLAMVGKVHLTADAVPGMVTVELWIDAFGRIQ